MFFVSFSSKGLMLLLGVIQRDFSSVRSSRFCRGCVLSVG